MRRFGLAVGTMLVVFALLAAFTPRNRNPRMGGRNRGSINEMAYVGAVGAGILVYFRMKEEQHDD